MPSKTTLDWIESKIMKLKWITHLSNHAFEKNFGLDPIEDNEVKMDRTFMLTNFIYRQITQKH